MYDADRSPWLDLYDYRLRVAAMFRERSESLLHGDSERESLVRFRAARDELFRTHPQSALTHADRANFAGLRYFPFDETARVRAMLTPLSAADPVYAPHSGSEDMPLNRAGTLHFTLHGESLTLTVFWIDVYGGGLFVPFRDTTAPDETYGAGRYLVDTVKGASLEGFAPNGARPGFVSGHVTLDFNLAYNPSCAYNARWACPLAPTENWLPVPIRAGELRYHDGE